MLKKMNWKRLAVLALALYLFSLVWNLPASFVWSRVQDQLPAQVELVGLTGTLWSGRVNRMAVEGIDQGALTWSWRPAGLLSAAIELDLAWMPRNGDVRATLQAGAGTLTLENVRGHLDAAAMASVNKAPFLLEGTWLLDVPVLELQDMEHVVRADGRLVWERAAGGLPTALALGDLTADGCSSRFPTGAVLWGCKAVPVGGQVRPCCLTRGCKREQPLSRVWSAA